MWWEQLHNPRGSHPRCVLLAEGDPNVAAARMSALVDFDRVVISPRDSWMPSGRPVQGPDGTWDKRPAREAKLGSANPVLPDDDQRALKDWWLVNKRGANMPNWDLASTCTIRGRPGLLLVEAKAHHAELEGAREGKNPVGNEENHQRIGECIAEANRALSGETGLDWALSRDSHYQMSNRFAWAWKLTQLGYGVVLVYLGFLDAVEMRDRGRLIASSSDWESAVHVHSRPLFPERVWGREWVVNGQPLAPLVRVVEQPFGGA